MKQLHTILTVFAAGCILFAATSCANVSQTDEMGVLSLSCEQSQNRTILPTNSVDVTQFTEWELFVDPSSGDESNSYLFDEYMQFIASEIKLSVGTYNFNLYATSSDGKRYIAFINSYTVKSGMVNNLSFNMESAIPYGTIAVTAYVPASKHVNGMEVEVLTYSGVPKVSPKKLTLSAGSNEHSAQKQAVLNNHLSSGAYIVRFTPYYDESCTLPFAPYDTMIIVNGNATSTGSVVIDVTSIADSYTITYQMNGGTFADGYTAPATYTYDGTVTLPTDTEITRNGYVFNGWYTTQDCSGDEIPTLEPSKNHKNLELYAKWTPKS